MSLAPLREQELSYSDNQAIDNLLKDISMSKWLESLYEYLLTCQGVHKCPLAYVARAQVAGKPHAKDPATDYGNVDQEMTSLAPYEQYVYSADNKTLWVRN